MAQEVGVAAALLAHCFADIDEEAWHRECMYNFPAPSKRDIVWLAAHTLHEGEHHLRDFDRVMEQAATLSSAP